MTRPFAADSGAARCGPVLAAPATARGRSRFSRNSRRSSPPALCHFCEILPTSFPSCHCPYIPAHSKNVCTTETRKHGENKRQIHHKGHEGPRRERRTYFYFVLLRGVCGGRF